MKWPLIAVAVLAVGLWCPLERVQAEKAEVGGPVLHGYEPQVDLPVSLRRKNVGGSDGAGLCVFTSIEEAARAQNVEALYFLQDLMRKEKGGGWPEKVDEMMKKYAPGVRYLQYQGKDPSVVKLALKTNRLPCVTLSWSERYGGKVAHMVTSPFLDQGYGMFLDNNFIADDQLEGMSEAEWVRRWSLGGGGWCVVLLDVGVPPVPHSADMGEATHFISWGPGGCGPVGPYVQPQQGYRWEEMPGHPDELVLTFNGFQVGNLRKDSLKFWHLHAGKWDKDPSPPPFDIPAELAKKASGSGSDARRGCHCCDACPCEKGKCKCKGKDRCAAQCRCGLVEADAEMVGDGKPPNFGIDLDKLNPPVVGEYWSVNGHTVSRAAGICELESDGTLIDDSDRGWIICIDKGGSLGQRLRTDIDRGGELAELAKMYRVASYSDPANLMLKDRDGVPLYPDWTGIMTLTPDGKPLFQIQGEYSSDKVLTLLRRSKGVDPKLVPDATTPIPKPDGGGGDGGGDVPPILIHTCCVAAIVAALFAFLHWGLPKLTKGNA